VNVSVPDLGDFADVEVIEVLVKPGDVVAAEDPLITLETEKAAMDVPTPHAGTVEEVKVSVGDTVSTGDVIAVVTDAGGTEGRSDEPPGSGRSEANGTGRGTASGDDDPEDARSEDARSRDPRSDDARSDDDRPEDDRTVRQPRPPATAQAGPRTVNIPDLGDFSDVEVIEVLVAEGDEVEAEQGLITLETEKATMDVPAPFAGTVRELKVERGSKVNTDQAIAVLEPRPGAEDGGERALAERGAQPAAAESASRADGGGGAAATRARRREPPAGTARAPTSRTIDEASFARAHASPSVRKLARELGVDLGRVRGSGQKGRVTGEDVKAYVKEIMSGGGFAGPALPEVPVVDFAKFGPVETRRLSRIQRISGPRLHASWVNLPHVTQHDEADITDLEQTRQELKDKAAERGIKLTPLAFVMRACALTLAEFPVFTASLTPDGESLVIKKYLHIGFAADTPNGLVVPVIRDADKKDIYEIAAALGALSGQARDGKLKPGDMQGGVFTISSLGGIGGSFFTPIINAPEVAILGVSRHQWKPVWKAGEFVPRLMLPLSLSYDHRVIDGAAAARFVTRLSETLSQAERLVEAIP
jgi:pyruvate dehydrogenase E2 component (dihydrolipoamide acetyltransferase)